MMILARTSKSDPESEIRKSKKTENESGGGDPENGLQDSEPGIGEDGAVSSEGK